MKTESFALKIDDKTLEVEFKYLAERANSSLFLKLGDTCLMATCVMSKKEIEGIDFFPLSVTYEEKYYAIGRILGSRFLKRESRPSEQSILTSRLIDRAVRPLFPSNFRREVQLIITCLSWDKQTDLAVLGLTAASILLSTSDIPWDGPVAPVRIGEKDGKLIAYPTFEEREKGKIDLLLAAVRTESKKDILINMVEAGMKEATEEEVLKAVELSKNYQERLLTFQEEITKKVGKEKIKLNIPEKDEELEKEVRDFLKGKVEDILKQGDSEDLHKIREELSEVLKKHEDSKKTNAGFSIFEYETEKSIHESVIEKGIRFDRRKIDQIRELSCEVGIVPRVHGTGLFSRGQTRVLSILTLGSPGDQKIIEEMEIDGKKRFMHNYNFPPSCVGETGALRGPGRREIGHGMLGEKALKSMMPEAEVFPYTVRVVSEVLCSNGSSSMASTCAACLALMDGGVPIKAPVAGIAMGLMMEMNDKSSEDKKYAVLTDVQGEEDHYGDMDFKVTGTKNGITALQMDTKVRGLTFKIVKETLEQAKKARFQILEKMAETIPEPRKELSPNAPRIYIMKIDPEQIGDVIGTGGKIINEIIDACDVTIDIEENGEIFITAEKEDNAQKALEWIKNITKKVAVGEIYQGTVKRVLEFGAFVEILPGQEGLVHISQLAEKRVDKVGDVVKVGDMIPVKVISIDEQGRINLSLKEAKRNN
jgi:polyribonucleotide nucleotidyltransferase